MRLGLGEHRHQHVGAGGLGLAGPQHVVDRALDDAREPQRRLRALALVVLGQRPSSLASSEERLQLARCRRVHRAAAVLDDVGGLLVVEQRQQQVLEPGELVPAPGGVVQRLPDGGSSSGLSMSSALLALDASEACSGISCSRANRTTWLRLGLGDVVRVDTPATPMPLVWTCSMICVRRRVVVMEELHQHVDHELLGGVVVVVQQTS